MFESFFNSDLNNNEFNKADFNEDYTIWKGKKRLVSLDNWEFDIFNNCFYNKTDNDDEVICVSCSGKSSNWTGSYTVGSNLIDGDIFPEFGDAIIGMEEIYEKYRKM